MGKRISQVQEKGLFGILFNKPVRFISHQVCSISFAFVGIITSGIVGIFIAQFLMRMKIRIGELFPFTVTPKVGWVIVVRLLLIQIAIEEIKALFPWNPSRQIADR